MFHNEYIARNSLKGFACAEEDFKHWAGNAYWIKDVYGLYTCRRQGERRYLESVKPSVAKADRHAFPSTVYTFSFEAVEKGEEPVPRSRWKQRPYVGHWYHAMNGYVQENVNMAYCYEANGGVGAEADPHPGNTSRYSFIAYPDTYRVSSRYCYIIYEGVQVYRKDPKANLTYVAGASIGDCSLTAGGVEYLWFPETPTQAGWTAE
jgi:hypothetical protein